MKSSKSTSQMRLPLDPVGKPELPPDRQRELSRTLAELLWMVARKLQPTPAAEGEGREP